MATIHLETLIKNKKIPEGCVAVKSSKWPLDPVTDARETWSTQKIRRTTASSCSRTDCQDKGNCSVYGLFGFVELKEEL